MDFYLIIILVSVFGSDFPDAFGSLGTALLSLFGMSSVDASEIIKKYSWSWIYFISYNFFEASIIMNVIVGIIVDSVNTSRQEVENEDKKNEDSDKQKVTLETLAAQIAELKEEIAQLSR